MGMPAVRVGDLHLCPMMIPGVVPVPHVGGKIIGPGCLTVKVGDQVAAVMGDMAICVGPPDSIVMGSPTVLIGGKPAAHQGSSFAHGGAVPAGLPTVLIG